MTEGFEKWYDEIVSHDVWFEQMGRIHKGKDFKKAAELVYSEAIADPYEFSHKPITEHRKHIGNKLAKMPYAPIHVQKFQPEENKENEPEPLVGAARDEWLNKWKETVKGSTMVSAIPRISSKDIAEEGGWVPKVKATGYMPLPADMIFERELHLQYVRECYDPITGKPNDNWLPEDQWQELNK